MTQKDEALQILKDYNAWRRDKGDTENLVMPDPKKIGEAIDVAITVLSEPEQVSLPDGWFKGYPPKPYSEEWFIAQTKHRERVVLKALPEEYSYDFRTADETYIKKENIVKWMQFPDSEYKSPKELINNSLPDGWVAVPVEPTDEMIKAATYNTNLDWELDHSSTIGNYKAMLQAAPTLNEKG